MSVTVPGRTTRVYELFDSRLPGHLWFVTVSDGESVQMLSPTFQSERAARIFERCIVEYPTPSMLTIDGQLALAQRIEDALVKGDIPSESDWTNMR